MTGSFTFKLRKEGVHTIAYQQDLFSFRSPDALLSESRKFSSSSSFCELTNPTSLQPSHTTVAGLITNGSKRHESSDKASWSDGTSHHDIKLSGFFPDKSHVLNCSLHQDMKSRSFMSSLPLLIISSAAEAAGYPFSYALPFCELKSTLDGCRNCQDLKINHAITLKQPLQGSLAISQSMNSVVLMPTESAKLSPDLNAILRKDINIPGREINICCSLSSSSNRQISMIDDKISESGWTLYLNQSTDFTPASISFSGCSYSDSKLNASHITRNLRNTSIHRKQRYADRNFVENVEDSSMISDASSGPEPPFSYKDTRPIFEGEAFGPELSTGCNVEDSIDEIDDACTSKVSCEGISSSLPSVGLRMSKRRKTDPLLRPRRSLAQQDGTPNDGREFEDRLEMLKQLIPNSEKLDTEEVLAVAIDYVKYLEQKIKVLSDVAYACSAS